jgi:hypothetical protein
MQVKHGDLLADVPDDVKDRNFVFATGYETDEKTGEERVKIVKIPKDDASQLFWNPIERIIDIAFKRDRAKVGEFALEYLSDNLPVEIAQDGKLSPVRALSGSIPPLPKAMLEQVANRNFFFGGPIESEKLKSRGEPELRYTDYTPESFIKIGEALGMSPVRIQAFVRSAFGPIPGAGSASEILKSTGRRFVTTVPKASRSATFDLHGEIEEGYLTTRTKMAQAIKEHKFTEMASLAREWNKKMIDYVEPLSKLTGQTKKELATSPYFTGKYTFQQRDLKNLIMKTLAGDKLTTAAEILGMVPKEKK